MGDTIDILSVGWKSFEHIENNIENNVGNYIGNNAPSYMKI